jgi:hypothetical protein
MGETAHLRKPAAIFLLLILLFNVIGYRAWFYYAEVRADRQLEASLDQDQYNDQDLVLLRVPLNIPYQVEGSRYERVDGAIILNGRIYKYVKRKVSEGNLILLCIPDNTKMSLKRAKADFDGTSRPCVQKQSSVSEYEEAPFPSAEEALFVVVPPISMSLSVAGLPEGSLALPGHPPPLFV